MGFKNLEKKGKRGLTRALGRALRARGAEATLPDLAALESILLVRQQNQLGDLLLSFCLENAKRVNPRIAMLQVSAKTGAGLAEWYGWIRAARNSAPAAAPGLTAAG